MPLGILLCEGAAKSPDVRILSSIAGVTIQPHGSKYGMGNAIKARRELPGGPIVAGIRDRDFERPFGQPARTPERWTVRENNRNLWLGWYWERVEIENYVIDPVVVARALRNQAPAEEAYTTVLVDAAVSLCAYTAARTALTQSRNRLRPLSSSWGRPRGKYAHALPDARAADDCRAAIRTAVDDFNASISVKKSEVNRKFREFQTECVQGGGRFGHFLTYFSGKDLLWAMEEGLASLGLGGPGEFFVHVLNGIETSSDDVWTWLPEWNALRTQIQSVASNTGPGV